tara:strand:- start:50 stop:250 length:201 start_codon:yes stop_codon:yes gene_type:complete
MRNTTLKSRQEACDAGIILEGMMVMVNGTQLLVEQALPDRNYIGSDSDGQQIEFTDEQATAIVSLG